jgi:hypothetical protein
MAAGTRERKNMENFKEVNQHLLIDVNDKSVPRNEIYLTTSLISQTQQTTTFELTQSTVTLEQFTHSAKEYFQGSKINQLLGFEKFPHTDVILGCTQFIDNLILHHGLKGLQILPLDYMYYWRLDPALTPAVIGQLDPTKPLLISMPFAGAHNKHVQMNEILQECLEKNIPIHIDAAWLTCATNIEFDFSHPAIQSFGMSLSKGMLLGWNRIGLRWSRNKDETDSVSIQNKYDMIPLAILNIGYQYLQKIPPDHLWNVYGDQYREICKKMKLRPTNIIHLAQSIDRKKCYSVKKLVKEAS